MTYQPGDRVNRVEKRAITGATVLQVCDEAIEIVYDEGGTGWWPPECLEPAEPTAPQP